MRTGLIAKKIGMTSIYDKNDRQVAVTLLQVENCSVTDVRSSERDGYNAVQVAAFDAKAKNVSKPMRGHFAKAKITPKRVVREFRVSPEALINVGLELEVSHFVPGQFVDVQGRTVGKGFAGVMKRYLFRGLRASHGVSLTHRSGGATGSRQDPGKVSKGQKMPGHMGDKNRTMQNIRVIDIDNSKGLIILKGSIPGSKGGYVYISDSIKKALPANAPFPAAIRNVAEGVNSKPTEIVGDNLGHESGQITQEASNEG